MGKIEDMPITEVFTLYKEHLTSIAPPLKKEPYITNFLKALYGNVILNEPIDKISAERKYQIAQKAYKTIVERLNPNDEERIGILEAIIELQKHPDKIGLYAKLKNQVLPPDLVSEFLKIKSEYGQLSLFKKSKAY